MTLEIIAFFYFMLRILAFRMRLFQEAMPVAGNTINCQNEFTIDTGCATLDNARNCPSNISVGNARDHLLNAGCLLVIHWQLASFEAIVLAFVIWQLFPLVIGFWSATGNVNHNWHAVLSASCLILIYL